MSLPAAIELYPGAGDNGLAEMMATLVRQNLDDKPQKHALFARLNGRLALVAEDADIAVTLKFSGGKLSVFDGIHGIPNVTLRGSSADLVRLTSLPVLSGTSVPDLRSNEARALIDALRHKKLRAYGVLGHLPFALGAARILSIH